MKAWVLKDIGDISLQDVEVPIPDEGWVRIRVEACGICGSDIPRIYETGAHNMPLICGHEFSGVVEALGKNVSPDWMGKRVAVFPKIACGKCRHCREHHPMLCTDYDYVGSRRNGAFAEYVTAPAANLLELPDNVGFDEAAMLEPFAVAANAVRTACYWGYILDEDEPVAICGLGTIGLMVAALLLDEGHTNLYMIANKQTQIAKAKDFGISEDRICDSTKEDAAAWLNDMTGGGVTVYFECVGSKESVGYGMDTCAQNGKLILVGNPRSDMTFSRDTYWNILRKSLVIKGIWNSSFTQSEPENKYGPTDDWHYALQVLAGGKAELSKLITHRFPIDELEKGFHIMRDKTEDYTKIMMCRTK